MPLILTTILSLLFSGSLCETEKPRQITDTLSVKNGGPWGDWGTEEYCPTGYIKGLSVKLQKDPENAHDKTGMIAIAGHCSDGADIKSSVGEGGYWAGEVSCTEDYLISFSLRVKRPQGKLKDDTTANNIKFKCGDGSEHEGNGHALGKYGAWSETCKKGKVCGIQTKVEKPSGMHRLDRTELNDVKFFCCK